MTPLILDTHEAIHELVSVGMPERQAETVVRQQARLLEQNLATKADSEATKANIEALRQETKTLIETAKVDLIKWIVGVNIGTVSLIVAMIKLL